MIINPYRYAGAGKDPSSITDADLIGWYRSDSIQASGSTVTAWNDKSGNNYHLDSTRGTPDVASSDIDGFDAVNFDTGDCVYDSTDLSSAFGSNTHFFCLIRPDAYTSGKVFFCADNNSSVSTRHWMRGDGSAIYMSSQGLTTVTPSGQPSVGNYGLFEGLLKSSDEISARWDNGTAATASIGTVEADGLSLGSGADGQDQANCAIVELCVFDDEISTERDDLLNYFLDRYSTLSFSV